MDNCIFCRIANGSIQAELVYEDQELMAFHDINPVAPVHLLVIPRKHIANPYACTEEDQALLGRMLFRAQKIACDRGLTRGARFVMNCLQDGGQSVDHIHLHILGGRNLSWPPG